MSSYGGRWIDVGDGVLARRYAEWDLSVGLVRGEGHCLVIDTRGDERQGAELAAAVRAVTTDPWTVVLTHAHFDHAFGTAAFLPCPVFAHRGCAIELAERPEEYREGQVRRYRDAGQRAAAEALAQARVVVPEQTVVDERVLDVGGREVRLAHFCAGHTGHDLVVWVPDERVVFAGDLVERGEAGSFSAESFGSDMVLADWPTALAGILELGARVVVPGHGDPVAPGFVARQRDELETLLAARDGRIGVAEAVARTGLPIEAVRAATDVG